MRKFFLSFFGVLSFIIQLKAQTIPVGMPVLEDYYRRMQLVGKVDSNMSFAIRPLFNADPLNPKLSFEPDSNTSNRWTSLKPITFFNKKGVFEVLPVTWQNQYNSNYPYGWNDGGMIPARGYQTMISGGIYLKVGPLSIQLRPEYVHSQNKAFIGFADDVRSDRELFRYYEFYNNIDNPERYGTDVYNRMFLGQSSIRLTFDPISIGVSNENIWWGPGISNALILTNNAPGFKHITINTVRPVKTYIGSFEFQALAGRLENSKYKPLSKSKLSDGTELLWPKRDDWRYFTGFNINYSPKWVSGLTFGLTRTFDAYGPDIKKLADYVPLFFPYQKVNTNDGDPIIRDQYTSGYVRWLFKKARAEVYFEYGLNDNSYNYRDFIGSPEHSRAYLFGFRKMMPIDSKDERFIMLDAEVTQTSQTLDWLVRDAGPWYMHFQVRQGQTNAGQVLGAGTGPGGNLQHFGLSWVSGIKKLGLTFDRFEHNVDLSDIMFQKINGRSRRWVDLVFGVHADWSYRNLIFTAKLQHVTSLNYQWITQNITNNANSFNTPQNTATNFHGQLSVTYRL